MTEYRVSICVIGGTNADLGKLTKIIDAGDLSTTYFHAKSKSSLLKFIDQGHCQLVIGNSASKDFNIFGAAEIISNTDTQIPIIGVYSETELTVVEAMQRGLSDYVNLSNEEHLHLVVERELLHVAWATPVTLTSGQDFTGLYSRLQFLEYLRNQVTANISKDDNYALLYMQLDNFSWINETNGILSGDIFLKDTAKVITNIMKGHDVAARYQGGSFIFLIQADGLNKIMAKADMIREAISESMSETDDTTISSTCSIGVRIINDDFQSISEIITSASEASERAKSVGGDTVHLYQESSHVKKDNQEEESWNARIKEAFKHDLFLLFYQPIISLQDDVNPRYEVFLRMVDDDNNIISPGTFLPHAERAGLMADIDRRVILQSLQRGVKEIRNGQNVELFIKLSGKSLDDNKMLLWISNTLKDMDFPNENLVFEITESLALTHLTQTRNLVRNLKSLGCKVALDHFGTRLKSFKLLQQFSLDYLKVDGSLVQNLASNKGHQVIVKKIVKAAKKKDIKIIAESVQEASYLPVIWQNNFNFVQGYFLQVPDEEMDYDFSNSIM